MHSRREHSDCRGDRIFFPMPGYRRRDVVQVPVTLPTRDEAVGHEGLTAGTFLDPMLSLLDPEGLNVRTINAEAEGIVLADAFDEFLGRAAARGFGGRAARRTGSRGRRPAGAADRPGEDPGSRGLGGQQGKSVIVRARAAPAGCCSLWRSWFAPPVCSPCGCAPRRRSRFDGRPHSVQKGSPGKVHIFPFQPADRTRPAVDWRPCEARNSGPSLDRIHESDDGQVLLDIPPDPRTGATVLSLDPMEWLRRVTNQIPAKGSHTVRTFGAHSNRLRKLYRDSEGGIDREGGCSSSRVGVKPVLRAETGGGARKRAEVGSGEPRGRSPRAGERGEVTVQ